MTLAKAAAISLTVSGTLGAFINPGTPPGVSPEYDCGLRKYTWEYGKKLLPQRGEFRCDASHTSDASDSCVCIAACRTLFEALQLQECNLTTPAAMDEWTPPVFGASCTDRSCIFVDATKVRPRCTRGFSI